MKVDQTHTKYEFTSEGPRGKILKAVIYGQIEEDLFNLAFGDWDAKLQKIDDTNRSNNGSWEPFQRGRNYEAFLVRRK